MTNSDSSRSAAAIQLADAVLAEFNDPMSTLKGIGAVTMANLLAYQKIVDKIARRRSQPPAG